MGTSEKHSRITRKVMVLWGWQLFDRRQDFGRFQPCDVRFNDHRCQMLIRYAKNDVRGRTREPSLEAVPEMPGQCPRELMRETVHEGMWHTWVQRVQQGVGPAIPL